MFRRSQAASRISLAVSPDFLEAKKSNDGEICATIKWSLREESRTSPARILLHKITQNSNLDKSKRFPRPKSREFFEFLGAAAGSSLRYEAANLIKLKWPWLRFNQSRDLDIWK
jgi:hypothetical protein